jgi:lysophospholipase L1-like esterase
MKTQARRVLTVVATAMLLVAGGAPSAALGATSDTGATHYYLSLGDSLAAGTNATAVGVGFTDQGYADQLHTALAAVDPKLELVKLGCPGESAASMRFGSQPPTTVLSCGTPRSYKSLYPKGTQLAEAVGFLEAHKGKVTLVTIDIGANDLQRFDPQGNVVVCLFDPAGCATQEASLQQNLTEILGELQTAAGPDVPIVGTTYYDVAAPLCVSDPSQLLVCGRVDGFNALLAGTYTAAGLPFADVAGAFGDDDLAQAAQHVCAWTWFCSAGDIHPNTTGYDVIARAFEDALS